MGGKEDNIERRGKGRSMMGKRSDREGGRVSSSSIQ